MKSDAPESQGHSSKGLLLDFSAKRSGNYLGQELIEDHSSFRHSFLSFPGMDQGEVSPPKSPHSNSAFDQRIKRYSSKPDVKKAEEKISIPLPFDDDEDLFMGYDDFDMTGKAGNNAEDGFNLELRGTPTNRVLSPKSSAQSPNAKSIESIRKERQSFRSPFKKVLSVSVLGEKRNSDTQVSPQKPVQRMTFVGLIAMARKMGLIKRINAYEDYMSQDQFNMIKDLSTGRFDPKEEKRSEQMRRLKTKLLISSESHPRARGRLNRKKTNHLVELKANFIPVLKNKYKKFRNEITKVIPPNGTIRILWDMYAMILIFYDLIMVPLTLAFDVPLPSGVKVWGIIIIASFLFDILLNFNTGFYDKGMLIMDRKRIIVHYLKGWFWLDFMASFPYEYAISDPAIQEEQEDSGGGSYQIIRIVRILRFVKVLRFLRVFKLQKIFVKLESYIDLSTTITSIIGFIKLSLIILFIAHWFACAWHFVSVWESESHPESWLTKHGVLDSPWIDRYIASIYWATTTMITVGYGDIIPITSNEKLLAVLAMLVASGVFAYTMNRINLILTGLETTSEQYQRALATITDYMRKKHVKKELQIKIKKYLEYALEVETSLDSNESYLNAYLNHSLKTELILEIHGKILLDNPIFMHFDSSLIMKVALILKEKIFSPEDPVFLETDTNDDSSIYIIHSGRVEIFNFRANAFLKNLFKGNHFGEISFFTGQPRSASARSTDFSALYLVKRQEFLEILSQFPLEREKFHEIKDRLGLYRDLTAINLKCYSCDSSAHTVNSCPKVHAVIPLDKYVRSYLEQRNKFMSSYIRSGKRTEKKPTRLELMADAARQIQTKIWEGELVVDKALHHLISNIEMPEFNEHPSAFMNSDYRSRKLPTFVQNEHSRRMKTLSADPKMRTSRGVNSISSFEFDSGSSVLIEVEKKESRKNTFNPLALAKTLSNNKKQGKQQKENKIFDDIDRVQNFVYYFPHNNFELLFPNLHKSKRRSEFDYFSQSNTTKDILKRFVNNLKERVKVKKELAAREKRRSSVFARLAGGIGGIGGAKRASRPSIMITHSRINSPRKSRVGIPTFKEINIQFDNTVNLESKSDDDGSDR